MQSDREVKMEMDTLDGLSTSTSSMHRNDIDRRRQRAAVHRDRYIVVHGRCMDGQPVHVCLVLHPIMSTSPDIYPPILLEVEPKFFEVPLEASRSLLERISPNQRSSSSVSELKIVLSDLIKTVEGLIKLSSVGTRFDTRLQEPLVQYADICTAMLYSYTQHNIQPQKVQPADNGHNLMIHDSNGMLYLLAHISLYSCRIRGTNQ